MANPPKKEKKLFEKFDYCKSKTGTFSEYLAFHDNLDPVLKHKNLIQFVCKMGLPAKNRRKLLQEINKPIE